MNNRNLSPQAVKLLDILTTTSGITPVLALTVYRIGSLTKRISELRSAGYVIERRGKHDGFGQNYSEYRLVKTPHESRNTRTFFKCPLDVEDCTKPCGGENCGG